MRLRKCDQSNPRFGQDALVENFFLVEKIHFFVRTPAHPNFFSYKIRVQIKYLLITNFLTPFLVSVFHGSESVGPQPNSPQKLSPQQLPAPNSAAWTAAKHQRCQRCLRASRDVSGCSVFFRAPLVMSSRGLSEHLRMFPIFLGPFGGFFSSGRLRASPVVSEGLARNHR